MIRRAITSLSLVIGVLVGTAQPQACSTAEHTITVFVRNGTAAAHCTYRLYPVMRKTDKHDDTFLQYLRDSFAPGWDRTEFGYRMLGQEPVPVEPQTAERFLDKYDPAMYGAELINNPRGSNALSGEFRDVITFYTYENDPTPYLLEIAPEGYEHVYLLGRHLGGCRRNDKVLLLERSST